MIVSQNFFDRFGKAVVDHDADAFAGLFETPALVISPDSTQLLETTADARILYQEFRAGFDHQAADNLIPVAREVNYLTPDLMSCVFDIYLMHRAERRAPSISASGTLRNSEEGWRLVAMTLTLDLKTWAGRRSVPMKAFARRVSARVA